jgi:ribosomal protein L13
MSTYFPSGKGLEQHRQWHIVDADGLTVGRLASEVARILMGKHKPTYTPFIDAGDHVIVINASKMIFKGGSKLNAKMYRHHTGFPGGLKEACCLKPRWAAPWAANSKYTPGLNIRTGRKNRRPVKSWRSNVSSASDSERR